MRACAGGVSASFLNQPIELSELRVKLSQLLGRKGHPQLMLRMGYGKIKPTSKRTIVEILVRTS
ncbi:MAG TPA: hypothetical protein VK503_07765 [Candidatus Bathyarchaeia archaeon]|nr:hypothetical protein [Candidatus Bathyarchaeia archaeon]